MLLILAAVTFIFLQQDVEVRLVFDEETLIRNGRSVTVSIDTGEGELVIIEAQTPYYSIYEYNAKIPAGVWRKAQQVRFEIGQVRRGDHLYIGSISVKQLLYKENEFKGYDLYNNLYDINSANILLTNNALIDIEVLATRAHTPDMSIEGPSFNLLKENLNNVKIPAIGYILCILLTIVCCIIFIQVIPKKYKLICISIKNLSNAIRNYSAVDILIVIFGIASLIFYFYGNKILTEHNDFLYKGCSLLTITLTIIKIISNRKQLSIEKSQISISGNNSQQQYEWLPYAGLVILGLLIYIPACFPNPYFNNDEHQVISAAEWYLANGNYERYQRAWPHTWMVAQAIKYFGLSTVSTRIVSALWGVVFVVSTYHITSRIINSKKTAFLTAILVLFVPTGIFSTVRMYAVMIPVSLWLFYCMYMTLHKEMIYKKDNTITRLISKHFNFHFGYAAATIVLIWFNYNIHTNTMILPLCAAIYVFLTAVFTRQRKFIVLSYIGAGIVAIYFIVYILYITTPIQIPIVTAMIRRLVNFSGFGRRNYEYFWSNIRMPLGTIFGVALLLVTLKTCIKYIINVNNEKRDITYLLYSALFYIITIIFFIFFADRYYSYVYMSFLLPITMILVSTGFSEVIKLLEPSTRLSIIIVIIVSLALQMSSTFNRRYIDNPAETKFDRPYELLANDAKNEELVLIPLYATFARRYFNEIVNNGEVIGSPRHGVYQIEYLLSLKDNKQNIIYFFSEQSKFSHTNRVFRQYLELGADFITDIDASRIYKFHFINEVNICNLQQSNKEALEITDIAWDGDVAYISCEMNYISEYENSRLIAIEITEQGIAQSATHRYQVLVPDDFSTESTGNIFKLTLPLRPYTEEYVENITLYISPWVYIFYGTDEAAVVEFN